ncbi:MAG UNVERIFIED_CONTAM: hypothetical protein LVR29_24765 [Microcystis novacekii LVE1205-3]|jgi:hypothetical protein
MALMRSDWDSLHILAECQNESHYRNFSVDGGLTRDENYKEGEAGFDFRSTSIDFAQPAYDFRSTSIRLSTSIEFSIMKIDRK